MYLFNIKEIHKEKRAGITVDANAKSYDTVYRKFSTDDKELLEKVSLLDDEC